MNNYQITKVEGGYEVVDPTVPGSRFKVTKPNGKMYCDCPDYRNAPKGTCDHIASIIDRFRKPTPADRPTPAGNGATLERRPADGQVGATEASQAIPELQKDLVAWHLEHPFRPDQIKLKDGVQYVDGASVIQRLNDVLGTANWSFRILGDPVQLEKEVIIRGRLTAWIGNRKVVKEDFGAHDFARKKSNNEIISRSDTLKSAATDCIKRCAHQLGVGLHLYSKDGSYRSFRLRPAKAPAATQPAEEAKEGT
ncbi:MAG: hypothetical protein EHM23_09795 [Acidobacteria bacterium]|nr:MAG: hypothetical protein EHM23_09795 [Acidobacteriota bacterium]